MIEQNNAMESEVRIYSRLFPAVFTRAKDTYIFDENDRSYLDFFCGAGSSNYGHNNVKMKAAMISYLNDNGIINSLDQLTKAKYNFMKKFNEVILKPRDLDYKIQFTGPTGTNAIEAALKLARKYTKRERIIYFEDSFHGMTYGSMSISGIKNKTLSSDYKKNVIEMPFSENENSIKIIKEFLSSCDEISLPAAIILETIQAEGGVKVAIKEWLAELAQLAKDYGILLIVDEIQTGCGRTGTFFSFERANIVPDIICVSKSLSGYGLPLAINLIKPEIDCWLPGEHNGTFRGNNLAFITATEALDYWKTSTLTESICHKSNIIDGYFASKGIKLVGLGFMKAIPLNNKNMNLILQKKIFDGGVLVDTCGEYNNIKLMPPLTISDEELTQGLTIIYESLKNLYE